MIRYPITNSELERLIEKEAPGWLKEAKKRTSYFRKIKRYQEPKGKTGKPKKPAWGEVKAVYRTLQHMKCAYCERKLEGGKEGGIEWDVEHYRPKSSVAAWPTSKAKSRLPQSLNFAMGLGSNKGYHLLPYEPLNYLAACKPCNTPRKSNFFPVAGRRNFKTNNAQLLRTEKPFLLYPIGEIDDDPETIITFQGYLPVPVEAADGFSRRRALVTISFFELNVRETLLVQRAEVIYLLWSALGKLSSDPKDKTLLEPIIEYATSGAHPHASCARAFMKAYKEDLSTARRYVEQAVSLLSPRS
jgi:hypothetical protein